MEKKDENEYESKKNKLEAELRNLQEETKKQEDELAALNKEIEELEITEHKRIRRTIELQAKLFEIQEDDNKAQIELRNTIKKYKELSVINVIEDNFQIKANGAIASINGFRLGRREEEKVEWSEINVALGHIVSLLVVLAGKFSFVDPVYTIIPRGSFSKIKLLNKKFNLYMESSETDFNMGLISLLEYINNFCKHLLSNIKALRSDIEIPRLSEYSTS